MLNEPSKEARLRFRWHALAIFIILSLTYTLFIHMSPERLLSYQHLKDFSAPMPYSSRVLVPGLIFFLQSIVSWKTLYITITAISLCLIYYFCFRTLNLYVKERLSFLGVLIFLLMIPTYYFVDYQFSYRVVFPNFQYPYDFPAIAAIFAGLLFSLEKKWRAFYLVVFLASLNRETALLIVFMPALLFYKFEDNGFEASFIALTIFVVTRASIYILLPQGSGGLFHLRGVAGNNLAQNLSFVFQQGVIFQLLFELSAFPLFWALFYQYVPEQLSRLRFIVVFYALMLFIVGMITEARVWGEVVALSFIPAFLGIYNWALSQKTNKSSPFPAHLAKGMFFIGLLLASLVYYCFYQ